MGNTTLQESTPSPDTFHGNNSQQFESLDEIVPNTSQYPPASTMNANPTSATPTRSWSIVEDEALISTYMEHCRDALNGTDQTAADLWRKVSASYNEIQAAKPHVLPPRSKKMLENRWRRIAPDITLWGSCYEEALKITGSGCNEDDCIKNAHKLFRSSVKPKPRNFTCEHGWRMVMRDQKWRRLVRWGISKEERRACKEPEEDEPTASSGNSSKRSRNDIEDLTEESSTGFTSGGTPRPDGVKKAKAKRKGKGIAIDGDLGEFTQLLGESNELRAKDMVIRQQQIEVREKELQLEDKRIKWEMLQALMGKASLTPSEEAVKEKLFNEMYGMN